MTGGKLEERWLTVQDIVRQLHVDPHTVRRWIREGGLRGQMVGGRQPGYRVRETDLRRFLAARGADQAGMERGQ